MYFCIPVAVSAESVELWVAALGELFLPDQISLWPGNIQQPLNPTGWERLDTSDGTYRLRFQRIKVSNLVENQFYSVEMRESSKTCMNAAFKTLPRELPIQGQRPFIVLLGSCYYAPNDNAGAFARRLETLPLGARPDVHILSGDQVYLDAPWNHYLFHTHKKKELESELFSNYLRSWSESALLPVLQSRATYFSSDDHEFWNNAPNRGAYVRDTWLGSGRKHWMDIAQALYSVFQSPGRHSEFKIGSLSFYIADTRRERSADRSRFMSSVDLARLEEWVHRLDGPGALVMGQPLLAEKSGITGHFTDWTLPNYDQYKELIKCLYAARHSLLILTGDVHFGRIASCRLNPECELIEIISSPLSLVHSSARGSWTKASDLEVYGNGKIKVESAKFSENKPHFLTLGFWSTGARVELAVRVWPINRDESDAGATVFRRTLI